MVVYAKVVIKNLSKVTYGFIVARLVDGELWYYGVYETQERAEEVAQTLGNGFVIQSV